VRSRLGHEIEMKSDVGTRKNCGPHGQYPEKASRRNQHRENPGTGHWHEPHDRDAKLVTVHGDTLGVSLIVQA
jgi:hypothetical protein